MSIQLNIAHVARN